MSKPLKHATLAQAQQAYADGTFVYHNPCSNVNCRKECSTPTMEIWLRRITEFGGVEQMYTNYECRNCRKANKKDVRSKVEAPATLHHASVEPLNSIAKEPAMMQAKKKESKQTLPVVHIAPVKNEPKPGDYVAPRPGYFGFSIWEDGKYIKTDWFKHNEKVVD